MARYIGTKKTKKLREKFRRSDFTGRIKKNKKDETQKKDFNHLTRNKILIEKAMLSNMACFL